MNSKQGLAIIEAKWLNLNKDTKISSVVLQIVGGGKKIDGGSTKIKEKWQKVEKQNKQKNAPCKIICFSAL